MNKSRLRRILCTFSSYIYTVWMNSVECWSMWWKCLLVKILSEKYLYVLFRSIFQFSLFSWVLIKTQFYETIEIIHHIFTKKKVLCESVVSSNKLLHFLDIFELFASAFNVKCPEKLFRQVAGMILSSFWLPKW